MEDVSDREAFRKLLIDLLAIRTAETLGDVELPGEELLAKYKGIACPQADEILRKYEHSLYVDEVADRVIDRLRDDLIARSRAAKIIEVAINISALLVGSLIGLSQFIFDPVKNKTEISAIYFTLLFIVAMQLIGNLYLKFFDRNR